MIDHATIPAERCYWVRLSAIKRPWTRERIIAAIEPWIPAPVDDLVIVWSQGRDGQVVVVACDGSHVDDLVKSQGPSWMVTPSAIPDHVAVPGVALESLDLLEGPRLPAQRRKFALALRISSGGIAALAVLFSLVGALRAHHQIHAASEEGRATVAGVASSVLPASLGGTAVDPVERLEHAQRLVAGLDRAVDGADGSAATVFQAISKDWPAQLRLQVSSLMMDGNRCVCSGTVVSVEDAQVLAAHIAKAVGAVPGWRLLPLQASAEGGNVVFTITATREASR